MPKNANKFNKKTHDTTRARGLWRPFFKAAERNRRGLYLMFSPLRMFCSVLSKGFDVCGTIEAAFEPSSCAHIKFDSTNGDLLNEFDAASHLLFRVILYEDLREYYPLKHRPVSSDVWFRIYVHQDIDQLR